MQDHYTALRVLLDELDVYQPLTADICKMRQYKDELTVAAYLSSLNPELSSQICGQILDVDIVPDL